MFKVGDEIVAVGLEPDKAQQKHYGYKSGFTDCGNYTGKIFTVTRYWREDGYDRLWVAEMPEPDSGYDPRAFRPVAKRSDTLSIESFMTIKTGQPEEPRRVVGPVSPKKEEVK